MAFCEVVSHAPLPPRHVDHARRVGIRRHAAHRAARGPDDGRRDVRGVAAALAQHARRHDLGVERHARHAAAVVGDRRDGAGHVRAVPAARFGRAAGAAFAGGDPVARILRIAVAPAAVVGGGRVGNEVVAGQDVRRQVGVRPVAGVDHRHDDAGAGGLLPRVRQPQARRGLEVLPLLAVLRVVRHEQRMQDAVGLGVLDVRVGRRDVTCDLRDVGLRQPAVELHHVRVERADAQQLHLHTGAQRDILRAAVQHAAFGGGGRGRGAGGAAAVLDDQPVGGGRYVGLGYCGDALGRRCCRQDAGMGRERGSARQDQQG